MKNGRTVLRTPTLGRSLTVSIVMGLCCYVMLLGVVELTHDHHDHAEHAHSGEACTTCAACFYCSQHVGEEIAFVAFTAPFLSNTVLPFYEVSVFLPLRLTTNTRSRAPPVFSNKPANFAI